MNNLGVAYRYLGQVERTIKYLEEALAIRREVGGKSGEELTLNNLGVAYHYLGNVEKAMKYYEEVLEIDPFFPPSLFNKALVMAGMANYSGARVCFDKVCETIPHDPLGQRAYKALQEEPSTWKDLEPADAPSYAVRL